MHSLIPRSSAAPLRAPSDPHHEISGFTDFFASTFFQLADSLTYLVRLVELFAHAGHANVIKTNVAIGSTTVWSAPMMPLDTARFSSTPCSAHYHRQTAT
jgi:hypothetical protein